MTIDWNAFTPWSSLAGGLLIGVAVSLFALLNGRIAGISGVVGGLLAPSRANLPWQLAFVAGLLLAPWAYGGFATLPVPRIDASTGTLLLAGVLVGVGTRYGAGCTSGHGVCGLSRRSPRSAIATLTFMASGFATVYVMRHVLAS